MSDFTRRRKSVPLEWREENHWLDAYSRRSSLVRGGTRTRAGGHCSCGAKFGLAADRHNMDSASVRNAYMDHVAEAYHGADYTVYS